MVNFEALFTRLNPPESIGPHLERSANTLEVIGWIVVVVALRSSSSTCVPFIGCKLRKHRLIRFAERIYASII
uniref:Uncharacterized protein n=1 Tax=Onchocerca volvulus TaxID=6282 RepID=A0A8R1Y0T5_ONCVO